MMKTSHGRLWQTASCVVLAMVAKFSLGNDFVTSSGDFTVGGNWSTGTVPGSGDTANINNGGTAYIHGAVVAPPRVADDINVVALRLGVAASDNGTLVMDGGTLTVSPAGPLDYAANAVVVGDLGNASLALYGFGATVNLPGSDLVVARGGGSNSGTTALFTMEGGTVNVGGSLVIAPQRAAYTPPGQVSIMGGTFNVGQSVVVGRGSAMPIPGSAAGKLVVGGNAKLTIGNSLGEGNAAGVAGDGALDLGRFSGGGGTVLLQDSAIVKALRLVNSRGTGQLTLQGSAELHIVNTLGGSATPGRPYNSFGGAGKNPDGSFDGTETALQGAFFITMLGNSLLDVDANAAGRDEAHPELQGLALTGISQMLVRENSRVVVRQRLLLGRMPFGADLNGYDGHPQSQPPAVPVTLNEGGSITMNGGTVSADQILLNFGSIQASGGRIETQAYHATYDPTANGGAGSATTSVNAIRLGSFAGTDAFVELKGTAALSTGELSIGHYGSADFRVQGPDVSVQARDVFVQKFAGSTARVTDTMTGATQGVIRATNDITINGGELHLEALSLPDGVYRWVVMEADSDHDGVGAIKGRFSTISGGPFRYGGDPRVFSVVYSPTKITVGLSYPGDADYSGGVNFNDLLILARNYNKSGLQWTEGDFSGDGVVNFSDLLTLARNYNAGSPAPGAVAGASAEFNEDLAAAFAAAVPEPSVVAVVGVGLLGLMGRRRRGVMRAVSRAWRG